MQNPNDKTAQFYDKVTAFLKTPEVVEQELELISTLVTSKASILDIGCGSGRHLIPLVKKGYQVRGIDSSQGLLAHIYKALPEANVTNDDIFNVELGSAKFDLITMFWNTWNEIALTKDQAHRLLNLCNTALAEKGKLIINIDDINKIEPSYLDFHYITEEGIDYDWRVEEYLAKNRTTVSAETITVDGVRHVARITQRWWSLEEIKDLAANSGFSVVVNQIAANQEYYLVLSKNDGE